MKHKLITFFLLIVSVNFMVAATCKSTGNGDWSNAATWSCGSVPTCGDSIVIQAGHTVTITSQQNYTGCATKVKVTIFGTLKFTNGNKLKLNCISGIVVMAGGSIQPGTGGGNSNNIEICDVVYWNAAAGTYTGPGCFPPSLSGCGTVLPLDILNFNGTTLDNNTKLNWRTINEKNHHYFILKKSVNLVDFIELGKIYTNENIDFKNGIKTYEYIDANAFEGVSYYKLEQVDTDGTKTAKKTISIEHHKINESGFAIFPNPANDILSVQINNTIFNPESICTIQIHNCLGQKILEAEIKTHSTTLNLEHLNKGVFYITLSNDEKKHNIKLVKN